MFPAPGFEPQTVQPIASHDISDGLDMNKIYKVTVFLIR